jgi:RNA polymerase sigma-70 factor (family 1)
MIDQKIVELVQLIAQNNDEDAFTKLYRHYFKGLISFGNSIVKNRQAVEDIVEDVFVKIWENRSVLPTVNNISHYVYVSTKYACFNYIKNKRNIPSDEIGEDILFSHSNPETSLINSENVNTIISLINALPPRCRLIFKLIKDEDMSYMEVAQLLDISVRTVNAQMSIAIARIIEGLTKEIPELYSCYTKKSV